MRIRIPFIETRIETDLMVTFVLTPLWWFLGLNIFIYHAVVLLTFLKLMLRSFRTDEVLKIPHVVFVFLVFLIFYFSSILLNIGTRPSQRIFASLNNFSMLLMGFLIMLVIYNSQANFFFQRLTKFCWILSMTSSLLGIFFVVAWYTGYKNIHFIAWLGRLMPFLLDFPFFYGLFIISGTLTDWLNQSEIPRLTLYSIAPTATAGLALVYLPMALAFYGTYARRKWSFFPVLAAGMFLIFFSMSRSAVYGLIGAFAFVTVIQKGRTVIFSFACLLLAMISSGYLYKAVEWGLNIRQASTEERLRLYEDALKMVKDENLLMGLGIHVREGFTFEALGSHSQYIDVLFVSGLLGLTAFVLFQIFMFLHWYRQKKWLNNEKDRSLWAYLGISLIALNVWLLTDTVVAFPVIPYGYFLIYGSILLFGRHLREERQRQRVESAG